MKHNFIRLVVLDVDGTLTNSSSQLTEANKEVILRCQEMGIGIVLATGKAQHPLKKIFSELRFEYPQIILSGSLVVDKNMKTIYKLPLEKEIYLSVINDIYSSDYPTTVTTEKGIFLYNKYVEALKYFTGSGEIIEQRDDLRSDEIASDILQMTLPIPEADPFDKYLRNKYSSVARVVRGGPYFLNLNNKNISKLNALQSIMRLHGINREEIIAIGDGENDIELLSFAGIGIAMGNANERVKSIADDVTLDNDHDGVAAALDKYILNRHE
ncbi:MAG: Cof-type HAD-IIB family hydrolase [Actinobacteria bacterium]|nr:Cof-type HAD-IIB family hydrolase [Actinomycetota bacterium]